MLDDTGRQAGVLRRRIEGGLVEITGSPPCEAVAEND